jgi:hypothetical protein
MLAHIIYIFLFFFVVLEIKPRVLHMLGECSTSESHPQSSFFLVAAYSIIQLMQVDLNKSPVVEHFGLVLYSCSQCCTEYPSILSFVHMNTYSCRISLQL